MSSRRTRQTIQLCVTVRQEYGQLPTRQRARVLHRVAIPQEMVRSHSTQAVHGIHQRPVRQERSAHPSADAIRSLHSRQRTFLRMETPRSHSKITFLPASQMTRCSRPADARKVALHSGSSPCPQCHPPTVKLIDLRARPRVLTQYVPQSSTLHSTQCLRKAAAQKGRRRRPAHILPLLLPFLLNGRAGNRLPRLPQAA